jgi:ribosomal protein L37AE/L43A
MQFPQEINSHIAGFIADKVRAADPECFRSARRLQALCRGALARMRRNVCYHCVRRLACPHRTLYWVCDDCLAELASGTVLPTYYDHNGFDSEGYDAEGYDREGYDYHGFDRHGTDANSFRYDHDIYRASDPGLFYDESDRYSDRALFYDDDDRYFGDRNRYD